MLQDPAGGVRRGRHRHSARRHPQPLRRHRRQARRRHDGAGAARPDRAAGRPQRARQRPQHGPGDPHRGRARGPRDGRPRHRHVPRLPRAGDPVPRLRGDPHGPRPEGRDLRVVPGVRRLRRRARARGGVRHRAGDGDQAAAPRHGRAQHGRGRRDGLRQPAAPVPARRPRLLRVGDPVQQPRAVAQGRAGPARTSTSTASGRCRT